MLTYLFLLCSRGVHKCADATEYRGGFVKGERTGFGVLKAVNGTYSFGEWRKGSRRGVGVNYDANGRQSGVGLYSGDICQHIDSFNAASVLDQLGEAGTWVDDESDDEDDDVVDDDDEDADEKVDDEVDDDGEQQVDEAPAE